MPCSCSSKGCGRGIRSCPCAQLVCWLSELRVLGRHIMLSSPPVAPHACCTRQSALPRLTSEHCFLTQLQDTAARTWGSSGTISRYVPESDPQP